MNLAYLSTVSALAGTIIGGVTTFATSWLTHSAQVKSARLAAERRTPGGTLWQIRRGTRGSLQLRPG